MKRKMEEVRQELRLANKAITEVTLLYMSLSSYTPTPHTHTHTQVRRDQLHQLLDAEQKTYEAELKSMGLTFHVDRS